MYNILNSLESKMEIFQVLRSENYFIHMHCLFTRTILHNTAKWYLVMKILFKSHYSKYFIFWSRIVAVTIKNKFHKEKKTAAASVATDCSFLASSVEYFKIWIMILNLHSFLKNVSYVIKNFSKVDSSKWSFLNFFFKLCWKKEVYIYIFIYIFIFKF